MTTKADFTEQEWDLVRAAPPAAGTLIITASKGGTLRETFELAKVYADTRQQHGASELLDELVSSRPKAEHPHVQTPEELREHLLGEVREGAAVVDAKATAQEAADYRQFIQTLAERVAGRHEEDGAAISPAEQDAIDAIKAALGA